MKRRLCILLIVLIVLTGCSNPKGGTTGGNPMVEDSSASGAVAQALGGILSNSSAGGLQAYNRMPPEKRSGQPAWWPWNALMPKAYAADLCPTFATTGAACTASGDTMKLTYADCTFGNGVSEWHGRQALIMSSGTAACGTFPNPGAGGTLYRQFINVAGTAPGSMLITSSYNTVALIDHASADLSNFDGVTIATLIHGGYGVKVDFNGSGARSAVTFAERIAISGSYDHTLTGNLSITEGSLNASSRQVNGTMTVYLNGMRVVGTSTFTGVSHSDQCCLPTSGTVTTSFAAGANVSPTALGSLLLGKSETLTFTGCGTGELTEYDGSVKNVRLSRCF